MAEPKWTPGPWEVYRLHGGTPAVKQSGETWGSGGIAVVLSESREPDACLIAAAPDLYDALVALSAAVECCLDEPDVVKHAVEEAKVALRKARGEE